MSRCWAQYYLLAGDLTPANYPGIGCFPEALPVCSTSGLLFWDTPYTLTSPGAGALCYNGQNLLGPSTATITMSDWDYEGWEAQLFLGMIVGSSAYIASLTKDSPTITWPVGFSDTWWVKVISTESGTVKIHRT